jgi:hypothetical protein
MGSKNGKYDFEHKNSFQNGNETLPSCSSELNGSVLSKKSRKLDTSLPTCIHRDSLSNSSPPSTDNLSLVWLDTDIHRRLSNIDTEIKLKNLINYIRVFDRVDACEKYIKLIGRMNNNGDAQGEKLLVIISTTLAPTIIPHLHDLPQVKCIYIYGKSKTISQVHQDWLKRYSKVCSNREIVLFGNEDAFEYYDTFFIIIILSLLVKRCIHFISIFNSSNSSRSKLKNLKLHQLSIFIGSFFNIFFHIVIITI